ncbi:phage tail tip lysozyme [Leucobacter sp. HY1910]
MMLRRSSLTAAAVLSASLLGALVFAPPAFAESDTEDEVDEVSQALIQQAKEECSKYPDPRKAPQKSKTETSADATGDQGQVNWAAVDCAMQIMDPKRQFRDISAGAVVADEKRSEQQRLIILDPEEEGGDHGRFGYQQEVKRLWTIALEIGGAEKPKEMFVQALEWELGVIGCNTGLDDTSTTPEGAPAGDGDWITPGNETYDNAKKLFDLLTTEYGVSGAFAAGVLGNVKQESGFVPDRSQGDGVIRFGMDSKTPPANEGGGGGLFQFTPYEKFTNSDYWGKIKKPGWSIENQVAFMWASEFQNRAVWPYVESNAPGTFTSLEDWLSTTDPSKAAMAFQMGYERPLNFHPERADWAQQANEVFNQKAIPANKSKWKIDGLTPDKGDDTKGNTGDTNDSGSCPDQSEDYPATGAQGKVNANGWAWPSDTPAIAQHYHLGYSIDLASSPKGPIFAAYDGVVVKAGGDGMPFGSYCPTIAWWRGENQTVMIKHTYKGKTLFSSSNHVGNGSVIVKPGQTVKAGQQVASEGMSGCTSAPHNHFFIGSSMGAFNGDLEPFQYIGRP